LALGLIGGGVTVMLLASGSDTRRLEVCAGGGALLVAGTLLLGPFLVRLGAALWRLAARLRMRREEPGAVGRLAREQLRTHPGRTALSGATLMIGVGLAIVIGVYVGGLRAASEAAIREAVVGDLAIESADGTSSMPGTVVRAAVTVPDAAAVSTLKRATAILAPGGPVPVNGVDPTSWGEVYRFDWLAGSTSSLADLAPGQVLVESDTARAHGLSLGSPVILTVSGGRRVGARVAGVYRDAGLLHGLTVPLAWFDQLFAVTRLQGVFLRLSGAVAPQVALATLRGALRGYPGVVVHNQDGLAAQLRARLGGIVRLLYALLGLTVVMSLLGLGAALTLSVTTRTRELGVLRALGMTPGQARRLIRLEGLFSAAVAGLTGLALGAVVSAALLRALRVEGFVLVFPWAPLAAALGVMVAVAVLATVGPARRAARADILAAIAYE
jgi:putative ABC transport system permease protein